MKNLKTYIQQIVSLAICLFSLQLSAQQHTLFSHYNFDHYMYNPGAAGSKGVLAANFFHRDQWTGFDLAPATQFIDIHAPFRYSPFALGGQIYNDNEGFLNNLKFQVSPTYQFTVNEKGNLGVGLGLNLQRYQLKNERNGISQIPPELSSDPTILNYSDKFWKFHINPGIYYNDSNLYGGISFVKLFEDSKDGEVATEKAEALRRHWLLLAGYHYDINQNWSVNPSILIRTERAAPLNLDINTIVTYNNLVWLNLGYRTSKMFMIGVGVNLNSVFKIGYNYDAYLNPLGGLISRNSHEIFLGYEAKPEIDSDMDGIIDRLDKCPKVQGLAKYEGCPDGPEPEKEIKPEIIDTDNDGINDDEDDCPNIAGIKKLNGCPELDSDNDGVLDSEDNCPNIVGTLANKGCPEEKEKEPEVNRSDRDKDGVLDIDDRCPDTFGLESNAGCPEVPKDSDGDGVIDNDDNCPNTFGDADNNGCPKPVIVDSDGDGIVDENDNCPNTFGDIDNNGCPKPVVIDSDGDGVIDDEDNCPNTFGLRSNSGCPEIDSDDDGLPDSEDDCPNAFGYARNNGCPDAPKLLDSDADGVPDKDDPCPDTYGNDNGCPEKEPEVSDIDGDGVIDSEDDCPNTYGAVSNYGCPTVLEPDSDGDGIANSIDNCPYVFGTPSNNGCPVEQIPQTVSTYQNILDRATQNLLFGTGSANIEYSSFSALDGLAALLTANPTFRLRIAGHTDNVGAYSANMDLSRRRAESVRDYLLNKEVSFGNMIVEYYGGTEPIADNSTPEGRKKNRRVDFELIEN